MRVLTRAGAIAGAQMRAPGDTVSAERVNHYVADGFVALAQLASAAGL